MTRDFLRDDVLGGSEATAENLQRATERILEELKQSFESSFVSLDTEILGLGIGLHERLSSLERSVCIEHREVYV